MLLLLKQWKLWIIALMGAMGVAIKLLYSKSERLEGELKHAEAKVDAARTFRENRKKANSLDISDLNDDIRRMFPPSKKHPGPGP